MHPPSLAPNPPFVVLDDARWMLVERIAASPHFKTSARLCDFLFYISECAIREAPEDATEQQIGIRIFHRAPGYNSSEDSIVRTHARLLRQKLAAYFLEEGANEPIVLDVPKGHYIPVFHPRENAPAPLTAEIHPVTSVIVTSAAERPVTVAPTNRRKLAAIGAACLVLILAGISAFVLWHSGAKAAIPQTAVEKFWAPLFGDEPALVIYSNAQFVGDSTNGLRYAPAQTETSAQNPPNLVDTYTGIGELSSVYSLTRLFDAHQANFILKRSMLMTWDEAKSKNLIFIGSIAENPSLRVLESTKDFSIMAAPGIAGVVNHHPAPGEPDVYSRAEHPLKKDYAILAMLPGVQPGKRMLVFSGLTTFGTQAAVEFVCRKDTLAELLRHIIGPKGELRPFECVLETTIAGGVPLQARIVTIRVH